MSIKLFRWHSLPVSFKSDGVSLFGRLLIPSIGGPFPGVILCHGMGSDHRAMKPSAERLARKGIASLIFDFRGHGKSEGTCDDNTPKDVIAAWEYLSSRPEINPRRIAIVGHSMGAIAAVVAASQIDNLAALVSMSCTDDRPKGGPASSQGAKGLVSFIVEYPRMGIFPWMGWLQGVIAWLWMRLRGYRMRVDIVRSAELTARMAITNALEIMRPCPLLLVHCQGDNVVPYNDVLSLYEKAKSPKELLTPKGGFHSTPLFPGKVRRRWMEWLVSILKG